MTQQTISTMNKIISNGANIAKSIFISILLVPFLVFAQNQIVLPNAGFTPESPFYFLDRFGEALREFFTFNSEGKARLQIVFAAERIAEIKVILETKGVEAPGLEVAQSRLQAHLANAATVLDSEKVRGRNVSKLASELDDKFEGPKSALKETFRTQKQTLENQEDELKAKIKDARRVGDTSQIEALVRQFAEVKTQKELLEQKEDDQEKALEKEEERIKEEMEAKSKAEKKIRKAEREKQEILDEAAKEGLSIPPEAFNVFNHHLSEAKSALAAGKFGEAKHHAEEAKENLDKIEDAIDDLEETREEEEELKEEQEEKEREAIEKQDERIRKDAKKEAERLEKEQKKAEEEARKAEERLREAGMEMEEEEEFKNPENGEKQSEESSSMRAPQVITVFIRSGRFDDSAVDVKRGDTIRWTNKDSQPHWPASNPHPAHANLSGFDALRPIALGESYEFTFNAQGMFGYHDHLNPAAMGIVIVK